MSSEANEIFCRICYSETNPITKAKDLISPCNCMGSVKYVHYTCLKIWRIKGKAFSDIKKCEQCHGFYNIPGEKPLHSFFVSFITLALILICHLASILFFKNIFEAFATIIEEFGSDTFNDSSKGLVKFDKTYHLCCIMLSITLYMIFASSKLLSIFNYVFTFWRLVHFGFMIDKALFTVFSIFFLKQIYCEMYEKIDGLYYYVMNINWMDNEVK